MFKIFDFKCTSCGNIEEKFVKKDEIVFCSQCGNLMKKIISAPGMVKGNFFNDKAGIKKSR